MIRRDKRTFIKSFGALLFGSLLHRATKAKASTPAYYHLVVLGDMHLPCGLEKNRKRPTIVFFHAPLEGALDRCNDKVNTRNYAAQPTAAICLHLASNLEVNT